MSSDDDKPRMHLSIIFSSFLLGTSYGHTLIFCFFAGVLIVTGAGAWMLTGDCDDATREGCHGLADPSSFYQSSFFSWGLFFDPGTQTGLPPDAPPAAKFVAIFFSVGGFIFNLVMLGLVVEVLRESMDRWQRLYRLVIANDHTVILGWTDKTLFLIAEQARLLTGSRARGGTLVVLGEIDTREMREEVAVTFPDWRSKYPRVRLVFRQGKPCEVDDLMRVSVRSARCVIVLGASRRPGIADANAITACSALRCLPADHKLSAGTLVVAELNLLQNVGVARQVAGHTISHAGENASSMLMLPATAALVVDAALVLSATMPAAGAAMRELMQMEGHEIHTVRIDELIDSEELHTTFDKVARHFRDAVVVGILRSDGSASDARDEASSSDAQGSSSEAPPTPRRTPGRAPLQRQQTATRVVRLAHSIDMRERSRGGTTRTALVPAAALLARSVNASPRGEQHASGMVDGPPLDDVTRSIRERAGADASVEVLIAPREDEVVRRGDQLLVIAEDELQAHRMYSHADLLRKNSRAFVSVKAQQLAHEAPEEVSHDTDDASRSQRAASGAAAIDPLAAAEPSALGSGGGTLAVAPPMLPSKQPNPDSLVGLHVDIKRSMLRLEFMAALHVQRVVRGWFRRQHLLHSVADDPNAPQDKTGLTAMQKARLHEKCFAQREQPRVVAIVGWQRNFGRLLRAFDARLPKGSHIFLLSEKEARRPLPSPLRLLRRPPLQPPSLA